MIASCAAHACSPSEAKRDFDVGDFRAILENHHDAYRIVSRGKMCEYLFLWRINLL